VHHVRRRNLLKSTRTCPRCKEPETLYTLTTRDRRAQVVQFVKAARVRLGRIATSDSKVKQAIVSLILQGGQAHGESVHMANSLIARRDSDD
jgi:hypothetical protein